MKLSTIALGLALAITACEPTAPHDTSSDASDQDPTEAEGASEDPFNCGELGIQCTGPLGIGECIGGQCGAQLSNCRGGPGTCDDFCAEVGQSCAALACDEATAFGWSGITELANTLCLDADAPSAFPLTVGCGDELEGLATTVRCCCM